MHVIPAEILNGHNKILIDNITSELIVIENTVDQNDIMIMRKWKIYRNLF
jgi:hypothetical protein